MKTWLGVFAFVFSGLLFVVGCFSKDYFILLVSIYLRLIYEGEKNAN